MKSLEGDTPWKDAPVDRQCRRSSGRAHHGLIELVCILAGPGVCAAAFFLNWSRISKETLLICISF